MPKWPVDSMQVFANTPMMMIFLFPEQTASMAENNSGAVESAGAPDSGRFETFS
jgi:hypothetical protein